jgi:hypothetical protein
VRRFVTDFLLPIVRGGALTVGRPMGPATVARMAGALEQSEKLPAGDAGALAELAACRQAVAWRFIQDMAAPRLNEASVRLAAALHNLLALGHPELGGPGVLRRQTRIAAAARQLASLGPPRTAEDAVARHSLLARLPDIVRVDRTVRFWLGRQSFVGRTPPARVTALPGLRRVRIESTSRSWLREIGIPAVGRPAFLALNVASPLGEALDPLRLDPPVTWGRIFPVLRFPSLARVVAGNAVALSVDRVGDALADALYRFVSYHDPAYEFHASPEVIGFAIRFIAHLVWLDVLFGAGSQRGEAQDLAAVDRSLEPGTELAVIMTAAATTDRALVWPRDVPDSGDTADAFRARLDALAKRASAHGLPRYKTALTITEIAASPVTRPDVALRDPGRVPNPPR